MTDLWDEYKKSIHSHYKDQTVASLINAINAYRKWRIEFTRESDE